jgi:hypothetical protein
MTGGEEEREYEGHGTTRLLNIESGTPDIREICSPLQHQKSSDRNRLPSTAIVLAQALRWGNLAHSRSRCPRKGQVQ